MHRLARRPVSTLVLALLAALVPPDGLGDRVRRLVGRPAREAVDDPGRRCPACAHAIPAESAQCGACSTFLTPWIRDADGTWLEADGTGGWRPAGIR